MKSARNWESLVDDLRNAFTGDIRDLANGVRVMVRGQQACAMYQSANASRNQYELAISPKQYIGQYAPARVLEWVESEISTSGRRGAAHKGEESWPTIGFANEVDAKDFLGKIKRMRKGLLVLHNKADRGGRPTLGRADTDAAPVPEDGTGAGASPSAAGSLFATFSELVVDIPETTEAWRMARQRIGQNLLRKFLMRANGGVCAVTGLAVPQLLRASHIKPWARSTDHERLNPANALLLAPHLDSVFDGGYATFDDNGDLRLSSHLLPADRLILGLTSGALTPVPTDEQRAFLAWHRENIFLS